MTLYEVSVWQSPPGCHVPSRWDCESRRGFFPPAASRGNVFGSEPTLNNMLLRKAPAFDSKQAGLTRFLIEAGGSVACCFLFLW